MPNLPKVDALDKIGSRQSRWLTSTPLPKRGTMTCTGGRLAAFAPMEDQPSVPRDVHRSSLTHVRQQNLSSPLRRLGSADAGNRRTLVNATECSGRYAGHALGADGGDVDRL